MTRRQRPGQLGLFDDEAEADRPDAKLLGHGFVPVQQDGVTRYRDPYGDGPLLTQGQASILLRERMRTVVSRGYRVQYPPGRRSHAGRIGLRRASLEGARHELYTYTGNVPHPGVAILDDAGARVWPRPLNA